MHNKRQVHAQAVGQKLLQVLGNILDEGHNHIRMVKQVPLQPLRQVFQQLQPQVSLQPLQQVSLQVLLVKDLWGD